uniref:Putative ovule protein n=1 Tax=Solanum chacoense TaxID=4108 RepID=A0A0V0H272_SOLCH
MFHIDSKAINFLKTLYERDLWLDCERALISDFLAACRSVLVGLTNCYLLEQMHTFYSQPSKWNLMRKYLLDFMDFV